MAIWQDVRFALRMLKKNPGFAAVVAVTLALGIGADATVYSAARVFLLLPLPGLAAPERLVRLIEVPPGRDDSAGQASPGSFIEWQRHAAAAGTRAAGTRAAGTPLSAVAACDEALLNVTGGVQPEQIIALRTTAGYFPVLGFTPALGRGFLPGEDRPGRDAVAVLSHGFWQRRFAGDRHVLGRTLELDGRPHTIVGVMPPDVSFPEVAQVWVPLVLGPAAAADFAERSLIVVGRLRDGVALATAQAQVAAISAGIARAQPRTDAGWGVRLTPVEEYQAREARPFILLLAAAAALMLVVVCANVANLLLARGSARRRELAVRSALGAGRARLVRQRLVESLLLAALGGALAVPVAAWEIALLRGAIPGEITAFLPAWHLLAVEPRMLLYTVLVTALVGLAVGAAPALGGRPRDLQAALKAGERSGDGGGGRGGGRMRRVLAAAEMALALTLLAGTGLMLRSFARLLAIDPGFRTDHLLTMTLTLPAGRYPDAPAMAAFYDQLAARVRALPGVDATALATGLPVTSWEPDAAVEAAGRTLRPAELPVAGYRVVSDDYFATLGIPLLRGRTTGREDRDRPDGAARPVAVVNDELARQLWPGRDPLGQRLRIAGEAGGREREVVGVVRGVHGHHLRRPPRPEVYVPLGQAPAPSMALAVRTLGDPAALTGDVQRQIAALDPALAGGMVMVFERQLARVMAPYRVVSGLLSAFALIAVLLAGLGIYGVIAFAVARRTQEIGIRVALGARRQDVLGLVVGQGARLALAGLGCGLAGAAALARAMAGMLVGVSPGDPLVLGAAAVVVVAVGLLASYLPARRAASLDPLAALRSE